MINCTENITLGLTHASSVDVLGKAVLIIGKSGTGKSSLALALMGLGADLIGDDQVEIKLINNVIYIQALNQLAGIIEARFIGILRSDYKAISPLHLIVDLSQTKCKRLPAKHTVNIAGKHFDVIYGGGIFNLQYSIYQWMKNGRHH